MRLAALAAPAALATTLRAAPVAADPAALRALFAAARPVDARDSLFATQADRLLVLWRMLGQGPDPTRTRAARADVLAMIAADRIFQTGAEAEADDTAEWRGRPPLSGSSCRTAPARNGGRSSPKPWR
jgi:hypothetical protein